tara:strand:+ start:442 stop:789 length:348 start_codon:yes stop_codon:yes gene_type:complete
MSQFRMETEEDMASYLDPSSHGIEATYINNGTSSTINIILNNEYIEQEEGIGIEATQPVAYCRSIDIPSVAYGNALNVTAVKDTNGNIIKAATDYTIVNIRPDRTGFIALELEEV